MRFKTLLAWMLLCVWTASGATLVTGTFQYADGRPASGTVYLTNSQFVAGSGAGQHVVAGKDDLTIAIANGVFSATLESTVYRVRYSWKPGYTEFWAVPTTGPVTVQSIITNAPTAISAATIAGTQVNGGIAGNAGGVTGVSGTGVVAVTAGVWGKVTGNQSDCVLVSGLSGSCGTGGGGISTLNGDVSGSPGANVVGSVGGSTALLLHNAELAANAATSANTANAIVKRDSNGDAAFRNVTGTTFVGALSGNATTATNIAGLSGGGIVSRSSGGVWSVGTLTGADLPDPTLLAKGGVIAKDCSSVGLVQKINTDGTVTCAAGGGGGGGTGDVTSNASVSVDNEVALFSSTTGKVLKRATQTGVAYLTSGVLSGITGTGTNCIHVDGTSGACLTAGDPYSASNFTSTGSNTVQIAKAAHGMGNDPWVVVRDSTSNAIVTGPIVVDAAGLVTVGPLVAGTYKIRIYGQFTAGGGGGVSGLADPGGSGIPYRTTLNTTRLSTSVDVATLFGGTPGSTTEFLRRDGTSAVPPGGSAQTQNTEWIPTVSGAGNTVLTWAQACIPGTTGSTCVLGNPAGTRYIGGPDAATLATSTHTGILRLCLKPDLSRVLVAGTNTLVASDITPSASAGTVLNGTSCAVASAYALEIWNVNVSGSPSAYPVIPTTTTAALNNFGLASTALKFPPLAGTGISVVTGASQDTIQVDMWGTGSKPVAANGLGVAGNCVQWSAVGVGDAGAPCGSGGGSGGANAAGFYLVNQSLNAPANAINLGALSTGLMKLTVSAGVATPSIAVAGTDYITTTVTNLANLSSANGSTIPSGKTLAATDDARFTNARTPTAHASSHQNGGGDEVATATAAANAIPKAGAGGTLATGWIPDLSATYSTKTATGDLSGTLPAPTVAKVNGVAYSASPSTNTVPIITASNTATYTALPDCTDSAGNHLNYNATTHALTCGTSGGTAGSAAFNTITNGTNSSATMHVDTGATLDVTGSGVISANQINGTALSGLATGLLKNTTSTGVPSIAVLADVTALTGTGSTAGTNLGLAVSGANTDITSVLLNQTGLVVKGATSNALTIKPNETLTAGRTLNIITGDVDRTLTFSANATIGGTNTGDQTITLTGDVSGTGTGSFSTTIGTGAVTLAKMANIATSSFLGRQTAGSGVPEVLSVANAKLLLNLSGSNSGDVTLSGENYLSITGQAITVSAVNLSGSNVTGTLAAARMPALTGDCTTSAGAVATTCTSINGKAVSLAGSFTTFGSTNALQFTLGGATNVTLPTSGTLATLAGSETLSSKTLSSPIISLIKPGADSTTALQLTKSDGTTSVLNLDTTNGRIGMGTGFTAPTSTVEIKDTTATTGTTLLTITKGAAQGSNTAVLSLDGDIQFTDGSSGFARNIHLSSNTGAIRFYTSSTLASPSTGAAIQFFGNSATAFAGSFFLDAGSLDAAQIRLRSAPTSTALADRLIVNAKGEVILPEVTFASATACATVGAGAMRAISDSSTATWGATITGSGSNHVLGYCDGTNWTVMGK